MNLIEKITRCTTAHGVDLLKSGSGGGQPNFTGFDVVASLTQSGNSLYADLTICKAHESVPEKIMMGLIKLDLTDSLKKTNLTKKELNVLSEIAIMSYVFGSHISTNQILNQINRQTKNNYSLRSYYYRYKPALSDFIDFIENEVAKLTIKSIKLLDNN